MKRANHRHQPLADEERIQLRAKIRNLDSNEFRESGMSPSEWLSRKTGVSMRSVRAFLSNGTRKSGSPESERKEWAPKYITPDRFIDYHQLDRTGDYAEFERERERNIRELVARERDSDRAISVYLIKKSKPTHLVDDPLAYYIPYFGNAQYYWGIFFKRDKMFNDFEGFLKMCRISVDVEYNVLWNLYVTTIFWHEMSHHVLEDLAELKSEDQIETYQEYLRRKALVEGFCEYNAFNTSENGIQSPCHIALLDGPPISEINGTVRRIALEYLYHHWKRDRGNYRPVIRKEIQNRTGELWERLWNDHKSGNLLFKPSKEIYHRIRYVIS